MTGTQWGAQAAWVRSWRSRICDADDPDCTKVEVLVDDPHRPVPDISGQSWRGGGRGAVRLGVLLEPVPDVLAGEEAGRRHRERGHGRVVPAKANRRPTDSGQSGLSSSSPTESRCSPAT